MWILVTIGWKEEKISNTMRQGSNCVCLCIPTVLDYKAQNQGLILSVHWHLGNTGRPSNSLTTTSTSTLMVKVPKPIVMGTNLSAYLSLSSGFNSTRVQIIVQTSQSHPQRASYPLDTTRFASHGPTYSPYSWMLPSCDIVQPSIP